MDLGWREGRRSGNQHQDFRKSKCDEGFAITAEFQKDSLKANTEDGENS